ncbi:hypothetical protein [Psychroflexus aestuariivivens]|uniref:hypothetical protein n=1 Tax=Psychroflexus aestuariivivens TaxID=1795040 RepID=UPI000FD7A59D|nr:hypothetical protein [Psychroflexus aestuariivivens]
MSKLISSLIIIGLLIAGCAVNNPKFFSSIESTNDKTYGYTAENPVTIKNADLNNSIGSSYYYLSRLRTDKGNKLQLIQRFSIENPNYKKPAVPLQNRYTGQPLSYGTGPLLDLYILKPENEKDTIRIYINPYLKGEVKVPNGLNFEKE